MNATLLQFVDASVRTPEREWVVPFLNPRLPKGWDRDPRLSTDNGSGFRAGGSATLGRGLFVMVSGAVELDGKRWIRVSLSRRERMPSYEDMALVKRLFLGEEKRAIQVFVPATEHYNLHPNCLHLWHCLDGDGLPRCPLHALTSRHGEEEASR